jgi:glycosyltransferase involved in cell wall biosynthesis
MNPKVSVVIKAFNHEDYVAKAIESVLNQTFQDFEIVVTDDGSTDTTADIIGSFKDPRINLEISKYT